MFGTGILNKKNATGQYVDESNYLWTSLAGAPHAYGKIIGKYTEDGTIIPLTEEEAAEHSRLNDSAVKEQQRIRASMMFDKATAATKPGRPWVILSNKKSKQKKQQKKDH